MRRSRSGCMGLRLDRFLDELRLDGGARTDGRAAMRAM